jgi:hypothetical protein
MDTMIGAAAVGPARPRERPARAGRPGLRIAAVSGAALALAAGFAWGAAAGARPGGLDHGLVPLLRMMAALKLATAAGAAWLLDWRLRAATPLRLAAGYATATCLMAMAPGLIWALAPLVPAAVAFHAGLILFLCLAYVDRDGARLAFDTRRARRPALPR